MDRLKKSRSRIHQNWLRINMISKKDRIHFKHSSVLVIEEKMKDFNPIIRYGYIVFDNIYQN